MPVRDVTCVRDTCNVWVIRRGREAVCIDFGAGTVLDRLDELEVDRITDVLLTHHHRDVAQGLPRAAAAGIRIWVPPVEVDLFRDARGLWERRRIANSYELHQDALTLLDSVEVTGTVDEYRSRSYGGVELYALPTPGHTMGSVSYLAELDGRRLAFSGDLVYGPGQVWSLAATQWAYSGVDGRASTLLSLGALAAREPDVLFPAHGAPIEDVPAAVAETASRVAEVMELRRVEPEPFGWRRWLDAPWREISPHLLLNTTSIATTYALLSDTGAALLVDWGYDLWTGWPLGGDRHQSRPLLESIRALRRRHGVERVEAVVTTHYHDDHVAGANLLRDAEGAEVWSPENVAPILEHPERYDLPCLWFDPIRVDRVLTFAETVRWHEYELRVHPLPGHTRYAAAIELEVDGKRVLATGDQQSHESDGRQTLNYQYRNRFALGDFVRSAELYARVRPDLLLTGHWGAHPLSDEQIDRLTRDARRVDELHRELLPIEDAEGIFARVVPYRLTAGAGVPAAVDVEVRNPFPEERTAVVSLVVPEGWTAVPERAQLVLPARAEGRLAFTLTAAGPAGRRAVAADLTLGDLQLGQHAEAVVTVE